MTGTDDNTMTRTEIRKIFRRHRGAAAELARELEIGPNAVSQWLRGRTVSANIKAAAERMARALLARDDAA